ncbi:hypothetical protein P7L91_00975 [Bisgaard Taxon 10/6]|uniref:hypothetical protein n=1 Tax=Exercitatus varius TaxID=67857 RepID=UPI00294B7398|nr:hypothetical protein [Exercitatus varius]MDG2959423.1 hypothetical protein [Exercitatus varius]
MMKYLIVFVSFLVSFNSWAEIYTPVTELHLDLDSDNQMDLVTIGDDGLQVQLSSTKEIIKSRRECWVPTDGNLSEYRKGKFELTDSGMRWGQSYKFAYEPETKRIRWIGYDSYAFGNAMHDGAYDFSMNLLTGKYHITSHVGWDDKTGNELTKSKSGKLKLKPIYIDDADACDKMNDVLKLTE